MKKRSSLLLQFDDPGVNDIGLSFNEHEKCVVLKQDGDTIVIPLDEAAEFVRVLSEWTAEHG